MWSGKILYLKEDIKNLKSEIKGVLFNNIKKDKLSPLEFTILENIFNNKALSGYDLIKNLNKHFAGTWKARSGTIYPILYRLKKNGFLQTRDVKSPIGPIKTLYQLTKAGKHILKRKVNNNFTDQVNFIKNFLTELSSIYIYSFPEKEIEYQINEVKKILRNTFEKIIEDIDIPSSVKLSEKCPKCGVEYSLKEGNKYCSNCGEILISNGK